MINFWKDSTSWFFRELCNTATILKPYYWIKTVNPSCTSLLWNSRTCVLWSLLWNSRTTVSFIVLKLKEFGISFLPWLPIIFNSQSDLLWVNGLSNLVTLWESIIAMTVWYLWKARCDVIFHNIHPNYSNIAHRAINYSKDISCANKHVSCSPL